MEEKIAGKIERIVDYIIGKPLSKITLDDYTILISVMRETLSRKEQEKSSERIRQLMAAVAPFTEQNAEN